MSRPIVSMMCALLVLVIGVAAATGQTGAQTSAPEGTVRALKTQVANAKGTSIARGEKINAQRTQIADQKTQIANLEAQIPPTMTPTPELSGKDAYTWLGSRPSSIPDLSTTSVRSGCFAVLCRQSSSPDRARPFAGETVSTGWKSIVQIRPDGYDNNFLIGFDGDTSGIYEGSYVCVWATVVDTASFTNAFGGTISNTLFDAEFVELQ